MCHLHAALYTLLHAALYTQGAAQEQWWHQLSSAYLQLESSFRLLQELANDPLGILRPATKLQHQLPLASAYSAVAACPDADHGSQVGGSRWCGRAQGRKWAGGALPLASPAQQRWPAGYGSQVG